MSKGFNLTAEINLRGPSNIRTVVADIRRQIGSVSADVTPVVTRQSIRNVASIIKGQLSNITCDVKIRANTSSLRSIGSDIRRQLSGVSANINVRANQSSIRTMAADIRRQLGSINANVNVRFNTAAVTTYSNNLRGLNTNLNQIIASATNATGAINALAAAMRSASAAGSAINNTAINVGNVSRAANTTRSSITLAANEMVEFGRQSGLAFRRFSAITTVTSVIYGLTNAVSQGIKSFIDFDLQMTRISQVTGDSRNKLSDVANTITDLSTKLGVSSNELTATTVTLAQAGLTAKDTATALKALALSALAPSFDDMNQTVEGSIALMRQFGIGANQLEMALGSVNAVSAKFAVEASDIITAIQRTGGVFAAASRGVSTGTEALNEFIAVFTSIRATTRESAETIATGLRTIFTRIQRAGTIEALQEFGVTLTDLEGKFVGPYIAVQRLSEGLSRLDPRDLKFSQIVEELGGFRQIGKVLPLIQQFATAQDALKVAQQGQGSLATDAAKGQLALANQIQKVREEFLALIRSVGDTSSFQNIVKVGLDLASALIKVADATKGVLPLLTLFAAFKGITAATQYIGGFSQGIRGNGGGARRANEGGRIYAFASGGLVPGYGNGDTVSAKLTPGEFVMRKSAVQSIGAGNLHSLNRNSGGIIPTPSLAVQKFEKGSLVNKKVKKESSKPIKNEFGFTEIIKTPKTSTQASHITELLPLDPRQIKQAILATKDRKLSFSIEQALGTSPKKIDKNKPFKSIHSLIEKSTDSEIKWLSQQIGLDAQRDIKINLPSNYNQALRRGDPRLIAKSDMIEWISKNNTVLNPLPKKIKSLINKNWIANLISGINPKNPPSKTFNTPAYDEDSELTSLGRHFQKIYETKGVSNAVILKFKGASKDFYRKLGGYGSGTGGRGDRTSIRAESIGMNIGGLIQKFGIGGGVKPATRTVGVIDSDDWKEDPIVAAQMKMMGITKLDEYKVYMSNLVAEKRKSGSIRRLRTVFGVAASGKTTAAYGGARSQEADNARLRKTTRRAIRVPSDLEGLDEVVDTTSVLGPRNAASLRASDRIRNLSSRSKASQEAVVSRRKDRDRLSESGVPDPSGRNYGLFNRRPGATDGAPVDTGIDEAWLAASEVSGVDPKKVITTDVATGRRIGAPKVRTPGKTTVFSGNVGPMTAGHVEAIMKGSKKAKTGPEDTVIYVAGNTPIDPFTRDDQRERTAIFPQKSSSGPSRVGMAQAVLGSKGFNVSAAPKGIAPGAFPKAFKVEGEDYYIVPKSTGNAAIIGNDKPDTTIERNRAQGYEPIKIARNGISGTDARAAIMNNDLEAMERLLTPEGIAYLKPHMATIQKRPKLLDSILARIQENAQKGKGRAGRYSSTLSELSTLPARVTAKTPSDVATRVKDLREQRDIDEAILGRRAARMLPRLERLGRSSGGYIQNFMTGGVAQAEKTERRVLSSSPTPMLQAILARVKKNPQAKDYQFSEYRKKITDRLNQAYKGIIIPGLKSSKEDVTKDTVISMYEDYVTRGYIDTTVGALEKDLVYMKGDGGDGGTNKQALKKRKGIEVGDMLDTIRGYQALGLDYVLNTALTEGRTDETIAQFMGDSLPKSFKTTGRGDIKISSLVKNLEAAAQYKMPETLYSGLGKSKLDSILGQIKIQPTDSINKLTNKTFTLPSFVSASDEKSVANTFARVGQMIISTNPKKKGIIPDNAKSTTVDRESVSSRKKKTKLINSEYGDRGIGGMYINESYADSYDSEGEYIFPPNSKFKVLSASGRLPSKKDIGNVDMKVQQLASGGEIQRFMAGDLVEPPTAKASVGDIIKVLGLEKAAAAGGISATEVYTTLNKRTPTPQQAASKAAILAEFTKQKTALASKAAASQTRKQNKATAKGLVFGAAGLFGSAFATQPVIQTIQDSKLKDPNKQHTVSIYSGVYKNQKRASSIDASFDKAVDTIPMEQAKKEKRAEMAAQKKRVRSVLGGFESGRELSLDFDRTLAFGADKILADPKQPRFSEFSDTAKVTEALGKAKLSVLGRQLASLVGKKPELLKNIRVITARPKATLSLIQTWLSSKGLPIQAGQFKGLGGPTVSGSDIAKLKAAELTPGSIFVDDDKRNVSAAKQRADEGIDVYRYRGVKKLKENTQSLENIESLKGNLLEAFIRRLGAVGSPKGNGFDFMNGLGKVSQKFEPKLPPKIPTDVKRTLAGPSTIKDNIVTYLKNVKGYNDGGTTQRFMAGGYSADTVPALVSNGEAFVPPETAKNIGYDKLREMNQADRNGMRSFSRGGISVFSGPGSGTSDSIGPIGLPVGGFVIRAAATKALGLSKGGSIQRFAFGGGPRAVPNISGMSNDRALSVVGVTDNVTSQLENLATVLQELGVRSSDSARIIQSGTQATYQQAIRATEADIRRARLAGASAEQISQAENQLADIRRQAQQDIQTRRTLGGLSGGQLQGIESNAQEERDRIRTNTRNRLAARGMSQEDINTRLQENAGAIDRQAYTRASSRAGVNLRANGLTGDDAQRFVRQSMGDPRILRQMDEQLRQQLRSSTAYTTASRAQQRQMSQSAEEEIRTRRDIVNRLARERGQQAPGGDQRGNFGGMLGLSFGLQGLGSLLANQINASSSSSNASTAGAIQGGVTGLATGGMLVGGLQDMLGSRLSPAMSKLLGGFGLVATAAAAVGQAFIEARNAAIEFEKNFQQKKLEAAISDSQQLFEKLNTNIKNVDIQRSLASKLAEAGDAAKAGIEANNKLAKAFWVNLFDAFGSVDQGAASQRSEILEKKGIMAYVRSTDFFGGGDKGRSKEYQSLIPEKARENSKSFAETSKLTTDLIGAKIQSGSSVEDIFKDPAWKKQAEVIARANAAVEEEILSINNNANISNLEKEARINNIIAINAEHAVRQQASVIERQQQLKSLDNTTNVYTRSLERMFQNMEQSIGRASFSLEQMSKDIDLASDSFQGQAKVGTVALTAINALQNPRAYSDQTVSNSRNVAAESFGVRSPEMVSLLGVGEKIEATVMSTINKSVKKNPGITEEALGSVVGRDVKEALANLSLPPDLAEKLSGEVGNALKDFKKSGDEKLDYTQISERLGQLNKVVDSSRRAQEVAIKALEHYQNALNTYTQNINKTIDLQISANQRLRKATDIVADAELSLAKTLGKNISLENARAMVNSKVAAKTGGVTDPNDIFDSINKLENTRVVQQAEQRSAGDRGVSGQADFIKFTKNLADTNVGLRENIDALKYLADNTDIAASAMEKIQEAQQKASGKVSFIEKLVTSTPEELNGLSGAFQRLQNNANGQINTINRSTGAQRAYYEALQNGASMMEAMKAAQAAFVNERKETLGALNDIIPFLGNGQQAGNIKANVLESMLQESGMGVSPVFQQILNTLRNPELDPATQAAIAEYREGNNLQARANSLLAQLDSNLARDIANQSAQALASAISQVKINFETKEITDIANHVQSIDNKMPGAGGVAPVGKASGGIIYASAGQAIDFKSQGTDTVPAMLTPGEFVVNRAATQSNLPLLQAINSNKYSSGGAVRYYSAGGYVSRNFKTEYKDKTSEDMAQAPGEYVDPKQDFKSKIFTAYPGPTTFVRGVGNTEITAPIINNEKRAASLNSIKADDLYLGTAPIIRTAWNNRIFSYVPPLPITNYPLDPIGDIIAGNIKTKKVAYSEWEKYRDDLTAIRVTDNILRDIDVGDLEDIPAAKISDKIFNPNVRAANNIGIILSDQSNRTKYLKPDITSIDSPKVAKIFDTYPINEDSISYGLRRSMQFLSDVSTLGMGGTLDTGIPGIVSDKNSINNSTKNTLGVDNLFISKNTAVDSINNSNLLKASVPGRPKWNTNRADIESLMNNSNKYLEAFKLSEEFIKNKPNRSKFENEPEDLRDLRENLFKLYNGANSVDIPGKQLAFFNMSELDKSKDNIELLTGLNSNYRQSIKKTINNPGVADEFKKKYSRLVIGGVFPDQLKEDKYAWTQNRGLNIVTDKGDENYFPWIAGARPEQIITNFKAEESNRVEDLKKRYNITERQYSKPDKFTLALPNPVGNIDLPYTMHYTEYSGPKVASKPIDADEYGFNKSKQPFDKIKLITPIKSPADPFTQLNKTIFTPFRWNKELSPNEIFNPANIDLVNNNVFKDLISQHNNADVQNNLKDQLSKINYRISLDSLVDTALPAFLNTKLFKDNPIDKKDYLFSMGEYLVNAAEKTINDRVNKSKNAAENIDDKGQMVSDTIQDNDLPSAVKNLAKLSLGVFGNKRVPGLPGNWLYNSIRGVLQKPFRDSGVAKQAAGYTSGIFNNFGGYLSKLAPMTRNPNIYQQLKELFTLGSGAAMAFAGLASGDTRMIGQFNKLGLNPEGLFRALGGASLFGRISSTQLSGDYQALLGQQLEGAKIKTVGANGTLSPVSADKAIPEKYNDLVNIAFNPYNEFPNKDTRKGIIEKLTMDMINAKDQVGMPYFDPNTQRFLYGNMSSLYNWYGGNGGWEGQDYFFDKNADPDNAKRTQQVIDSLRDQDGRDAYTKGNVAHNTLGFASRYGSLPTDKWFVQRREAGLNAEAQPDRNNEALRFATGGVVYAQNGQYINFQPRGTDTVPAMLTPGEFVVNRAATQANLPLLQSINKSSGGKVSYYAGGGVASLMLSNGPPDTKDTAQTSSYFRNVQEIIFNDKLISSNLTRAVEQTQDIKDDTNNLKFNDQKILSKITATKNSKLDASMSTLDSTKLSNIDKNTRPKPARFIFGGDDETGQIMEEIGLATDIAQSIKDKLEPGIDNIREDIKIATQDIIAVAANPATFNNAVGLNPAGIRIDAAARNAVNRFSQGGVVYAAEGTLIPYQPKGTDTVPAMLTPGEFVVNRQATQQNLPLLQSINNGSYLVRGGKVKADEKLFPKPGKLRSDYHNLDMEDLMISDEYSDPITQATKYVEMMISKAQNIQGEDGGLRKASTLIYDEIDKARQAAVVAKQKHTKASGKSKNTGTVYNRYVKNKDKLTQVTVSDNKNILEELFHGLDISNIGKISGKIETTEWDKDNISQLVPFSRVRIAQELISSKKFQEIDKNEDGLIDLSEFKNLNQMWLGNAAMISTNKEVADASNQQVYYESIQEKLGKALEDARNKNPQGFANGGVVYAQEGMKIPKSVKPIDLLARHYENIDGGIKAGLKQAIDYDKGPAWGVKPTEEGYNRDIPVRSEKFLNKQLGGYYSQNLYEANFGLPGRIGINANLKGDPLPAIEHEATHAALVGPMPTSTFGLMFSKKKRAQYHSSAANFLPDSAHQDYHDYLTSPAELDVRLAEVKRLYAREKGILVTSPEAAQEAWEYYKTRYDKKDIEPKDKATLGHDWMYLQEDRPLFHQMMNRMPALMNKGGVVYAQEGRLISGLDQYLPSNNQAMPEMVPTQGEIDFAQRQAQKQKINTDNNGTQWNTQAGEISAYGPPPGPGMLGASFYERSGAAWNMLTDIGQARLATARPRGTKGKTFASVPERGKTPGTAQPKLSATDMSVKSKIDELSSRKGVIRAEIAKLNGQIAVLGNAKQADLTGDITRTASAFGTVMSFRDQKNALVNNSGSRQLLLQDFAKSTGRTNGGADFSRSDDAVSYIKAAMLEPLSRTPEELLSRQARGLIYGGTKPDGNLTLEQFKGMTPENIAQLDKEIRAANSNAYMVLGPGGTRNTGRSFGNMKEMDILFKALEQGNLDGLDITDSVLRSSIQESLQFVQIKKNALRSKEIREQIRKLETESASIDESIRKGQSLLDPEPVESASATPVAPAPPVRPLPPPPPGRSVLPPPPGRPVPPPPPYKGGPPPLPSFFPPPPPSPRKGPPPLPPQYRTMGGVVYAQDGMRIPLNLNDIADKNPAKVGYSTSAEERYMERWKKTHADLLADTSEGPGMLGAPFHERFSAGLNMLADIGSAKMAGAKATGARGQKFASVPRSGRSMRKPRITSLHGTVGPQQLSDSTFDQMVARFFGQNNISQELSQNKPRVIRHSGGTAYFSGENVPRLVQREALAKGLSPSIADALANHDQPKESRVGGKNHNTINIPVEGYGDNIDMKAVMAHEQFHSVQEFLLRNKPQLYDQLHRILKSRQSEITDILIKGNFSNTQKSAYGPDDIFGVDNQLPLPYDVLGRWFGISREKDIKRILKVSDEGHLPERLIHSLGGMGTEEAQDSVDLWKQAVSTIGSNRATKEDLMTAINTYNVGMIGTRLKSAGIKPKEIKGHHSSKLNSITENVGKSMGLDEAIPVLLGMEQRGDLNASSILDKIGQQLQHSIIHPDKKAAGGLIYASKGTLVNYQPRGTDTVPAMLTPGEFVVNAKATSKNLSLLRSINDGAQGYSDGGIVYLQKGALVSPPSPRWNTKGTAKPSEDEMRDRRDAYKRRLEDMRNNSPYQRMLRDRDNAYKANQAAREKAYIDNKTARRDNNKSPLVKIFDEVEKQVNASPGKFELITPGSVRSKDPVDKDAKTKSDAYEQQFMALAPEDVYKTAKDMYLKDQRQFRYLQGIHNRSQAAVNQFNRYRAIGNKQVGQTGHTALAILSKQVEAAHGQGLVLDNAWKILGQNHPEFLAQNSNRQNAAGHASGGIIYANNGMLIPYQPRGTDTVPAMLTPGEFVVNKQAAQNNLNLLQQINSNRYNQGGHVVYKEAGGPIQLKKPIYRANGGMTDETSGGGGGVSNNKDMSLNFDGLSQFTATFGKFIQQLNSLKLPEVINIQGNHKVDVVINGAGALQGMQEGIRSMIVGEVNKAMNSISKQTDGAIA